MTINPKEVIKLFYAVFIIAFLWGCASTPATNYSPDYRTKKSTQRPYQIDGKWYHPVDSAFGYEEEGIASWYGKDFHGRKTSNGEIYDMHTMTAAHKTLPLGTFVKVTRLDNEKEAIVRVNDRGPFVDGRIIDLSYKAASEIGIVETGTIMVRIEALGEATGDSLVKRDYQHGSFFVQVGAFTVKENAERLRNKMEQAYGNASIYRFDRGDMLFYRVRIGGLTNTEDAERLKKRVLSDGIVESSFVVAD